MITKQNHKNKISNKTSKRLSLFLTLNKKNFLQRPAKQNLASFSLISLLTFTGVYWKPSVSQGQNQEGQDKEVVLNITDVYVPSRFSVRSNSFVVISGFFPNGCYRWSKAEVKRNENFSFEIRSIAQVKPGACSMALVPFTEEVPLGYLKQGEHILRFVAGDGTWVEKPLFIHH
jgi:hypothetical protein